MDSFKSLILLSSLLLFAGCGREPMVKIYPEAKEANITCLKLHVNPKSRKIEKALNGLYSFDPSCETVLEVKHKENICCNSNQNAFRKAVSDFPRNFLRMEVRRGFSLLYSYYLDLDKEADAEDAVRAFDRAKRDLRLYKSDK